LERWSVEALEGTKRETTSGKPTVIRTERGLTIANTRITLYQIMDYVQAGMSPSLIRDHFKLTIKQTADVLHYIETHQEEIKTE
jgi:chaperonin GroEL (HSP60 family)